MKNYYFILLLAISCIACGSKSTPNNNDNGNNSTITNTEDVNAAYNEGYKNGFNNGYIDGSERKGYMYSYNYNRDNHYKTYNAGKAYIDAYREGYPKGFKEGETLANYEAKQAPEEYGTTKVTVTTNSTHNNYIEPRTLTDESNYKNWEEDEISAFYVELEDCESDEQAEYISNEYYLGEYIEESGRYFAKARVNSGTYEAELGERVSSKLFKIKGTRFFARFKYLPNAYKWDEGVLEVWSNKGSFYKKPD